MKLAISGKGGVGKSTIAATLALLMSRRGQRVLAIDADPDANLAAALGIPTVSIFGPTDPTQNGAYGVNHETVYKILSCSFCWKKTCPLGTKECMNRVTSDEVFEAVKGHKQVASQLS